ncbi:15297_t:CDS:2, partial [Cetraspora pellucida]
MYTWISKEPTKLPIKLPDGKLRYQESDNDSNEDISEFIPIQNISSNSDITQKKEELATIAQMIIEDPENNIRQLKVLREISASNNLTIKKLALLTQLVVYKDIIPGYRIRQLTDKEKTTKVSEEVKKLRHFEQNLVSNYQAYLKSLETELKGVNYLLALFSQRSLLIQLPSMICQEHTITETALKCMCDLLISVTHFNFRLNLMMTIVSRLSTSKFTKMSAMCCDTIIEIFKNDESGEASLDAVKLITKMIKSKSYVVHEEVLNTFLHLRLKEELSVKTLNNEDSFYDKTKGKKRKFDKQGPKKHLSKKLKKLYKERKEVEKDMKEAEAVVNREEREKT